MYADSLNISGSGGANKIKVQGSENLRLPSNFILKDYEGGGGMSYYPWVLFIVDSNHRGGKNDYINDIFYYLKEGGQVKAISGNAGQSNTLRDHITTYKHAFSS